MSNVNEKLLETAKKGNLEALKAALGAGADANTGDSDGWTALHQAASKGHADCLTILLERGADINVGDKHGWTVVHHAAYNGHAGCLALLLERGADVSTGDSDGWTALHQAASKGHADCLAVLLKRGADVNAKSNLEKTAMYLVVSEGHADCLATLLERDADVNAKSHLGKTEMYWAAFYGHTDYLSSLLHYGADANGTDRDILLPVLTRMRDTVTTTFADNTISHSQCLTNDDPPHANNVILDSLATELFRGKIATSLLAQGTEGKTLLAKIIRALPNRIKSLHAPMLTAVEQQLQPHRSFAARINPASHQGRSI